ncbi:hypothetical protein BJ912DRAFT_1058850 [Pholiota molesta]|nr:hypothetical protein BJ912DRAFT_1058850 [Pholiota molesta]
MRILLRFPLHLLTHPPSRLSPIHLFPLDLSRHDATSTTDDHERTTRRHHDDDATKEREERARGDPGAGDPQASMTRRRNDATAQWRN